MAQAIGRLGCLFNGCCFGTPTTLPWGLVYTDPMSFGFNGGIPDQPTVAYEIIYCLIIFVVLMLLRKKLKPDGSLFILYLALYAVWRLGIDFLRDGTSVSLRSASGSSYQHHSAADYRPLDDNPHQMGQEKYPNSPIF